MLPMKAIVALLLTCSIAHADPAPKLDTLVLPLTGLTDAPKGTNAPRILAGLFGGITVKPEPYSNDGGAPVVTGKLQSKVIGWAADKKAAWVAADVKLSARCSDSDSACKKQKPTT